MLPPWARWLSTAALGAAWGTGGLLGFAAASIGWTGCFITCGDPEPVLVVVGVGVMLLALAAIAVVVRWAWKGWPGESCRGLRVATALAIGAPLALFVLQALAATLDSVV